MLLTEPLPQEPVHRVPSTETIRSERQCWILDTARQEACRRHPNTTAMVMETGTAIEDLLVRDRTRTATVTHHKEIKVMAMVVEEAIRARTDMVGRTAVVGDSTTTTVTAVGAEVVVIRMVDAL